MHADNSELMQVNDFHLLMAEVFSKMLHSDSFCFLYFALLSFFFLRQFVLSFVKGKIFSRLLVDFTAPLKPALRLKCWCM